MMAAFRGFRVWRCAGRGFGTTAAKTEEQQAARKRRRYSPRFMFFFLEFQQQAGLLVGELDCQPAWTSVPGVSATARASCLVAQRPGRRRKLSGRSSSTVSTLLGSGDAVSSTGVSGAKKDSVDILALVPSRAVPAERCGHGDGPSPESFSGAPARMMPSDTRMVKNGNSWSFPMFFR